MDFALVAPELPLSPLPLAQVPPMEPNGDWILNWLEVAPPVEDAPTIEPAPRPISVTVNATVSQAPEWLLGMKPAAPAPAVFEKCTSLVEEQPMQTEPSIAPPIFDEDVAAEGTEEDSEEEPDSEDDVVAVAIPAWTARPTPPASEPLAQTPTRPPEFAARRVAQNAERRTATQVPEDKGELVWKAELVVKTPGPSISRDTVSEPETQENSAVVPQVAKTPERSGETQDAPMRKENDPEERPPTAKPEAKRNAAADTENVPERVESAATSPRAAKRTGTIDHRAVFPTAAPSPRFVSEAPMATKTERVEGPGAIEAATPTQRIRPVQVARVQVDIASPGQAPGTDPAMRLVLTQRGENVNVQLRSWNESIAPIPAADVQPLLDNLAKQGLTTAESESGIENAIATEAPKERPLQLGQSTANHPDSGGFHGFDERQQRQQEQHRQQQELYWRRQRQAGGEFNLESVLDESKSR